MKAKKKTVYGSMQKGGVLRDEEGNLVAKEGGKMKKAKGGMKMYKNGGRRKKQSIPRADRTDIKLTGRKRAEDYRSRRIREAMNKQAAMDQQNEQDGGDRKLGDPNTGTRGTLNLVSQDPKKQAKLLRMNARVDAKSTRALNRKKRRKNKPVVKKLTKGLEARRKRKRVRMYDKMKDLRVMDKDRFIRHMRENEPTSFSPKDPTSMRKRTRRTK